MLFLSSFLICYFCHRFSSKHASFFLSSCKHAVCMLASCKHKIARGALFVDCGYAIPGPRVIHSKSRLQHLCAHPWSPFTRGGRVQDPVLTQTRPSHGAHHVTGGGLNGRHSGGSHVCSGHVPLCLLMPTQSRVRPHTLILDTSKDAVNLKSGSHLAYGSKPLLLRHPHSLRAKAVVCSRVHAAK